MDSPVATQRTAMSLKDPVSIKVFRLNRARLDSSHMAPMSGDASDFFQSQIEALNNKLNGLEIGSDDPCGCTLLLPDTIHKIYIGETINLYVRVQNISDVQLCDVALKISLQSTAGTSALPNKYQDGGVTLNLHEAIDIVVTHEIKSIGQIYIACMVTCTTLTRTVQSDEMTQKNESRRKVFKCNVMKPLDVRTKMHNADGRTVFVEAYLENQMDNIMVLEKMTLEPTDLYQLDESIPFPTMRHMTTNEGPIQTMNEITNDLLNKQELKPAYLRPKDVWSFLYKLTSKYDDESKYKGGTDIGKIWIEWRTAMGEKGRLQTSALKTVAPGTGDVRLRVIRSPSTCYILEAAKITFTIANCTERQMDLKLVLEENQSPSLVWCNNVSGIQLGKLEPLDKVEHSLNIVPTLCGLFSISGVRVIDTMTNRTYEFDDIAQFIAIAQ